MANLDARKRLAAQALTAPLTGLANRRAFEARLDAEVQRARRRGTPLALALLDLDFLKRTNDEGGHEAGDALLRSLADALREVSRGEDHVARLGGDEFAWLLPDAPTDAARRAVERLHELLAARGASVSVGLAELDAKEGPEALVRRADAALYVDKAAGRSSSARRGDAAPRPPEDLVPETSSGG